ncbi:DUF1501 domain-containing protein [Erythrobacter sp. SDW2]|uniref:DUF1501 domain-containing protein n=1 Tax=Erythrobacter sp. SDW2 TaxID=2907154 RepID=UPI001F269F77|nr:DUF1501 domain-containing protein [Erythrobacter sp. SDW2]UIP06252.1 DUF1501 domain-containing protein [Erythrobacter sp. SDW2]
MTIRLNRRAFSLGSFAIGGMVLASPGSLLAAATGNKRLLFVIQRGAADGLATLAPTGDPDCARLRATLLEDYTDAPQVGDFFQLHPAYAQVAAMAVARQALFVHAAATTYRERSHFDGQNLLESGGAKAYQLRDGWLNRLVTLLSGEKPRALALSPSVPLALQGPAHVSSYAPSALPGARESLLQRVATLYESDPQLSQLLADAVSTRAMAGETGLRNLRNAEDTGTLAASLMKGPKGARIMMVESGDWDTHFGQSGQFSIAAKRLDAMLGAFRTGMGADWNDTLVLVVTEFGRTAGLNGSGGTDHGTASAIMLLGGTVAGGRVIADWPGLRQTDLFEARDLRPTIATESVITGAIAGHFGLDPDEAMQTLFPGRGRRATEGLLRT